MHCIAHALLVILVVAPLDLIVRGQSRDWRVYSSTDDQFTVEIPATSRMVKTNERKNRANHGPDQSESLASYISLYEDDPSGQYSRFKVFVINGKADIFKSFSRSDLLEYLSIMVIGDDDDPKPTSEKGIEVNRLKGREYVWSKESKVFEYGRSNEIFTRGRIFDQGDKIYIIVFIGENSDGLKSPTAERFMSSLRLSNGKR